MKKDIEKELLQGELFKSYGHFNLLFENEVQELRNLLISLIRISYNYFEEEDEEENELPDIEQDRLIKILMQSMGAMEIVENCKACFIDFFTRQKNKNGNYSFTVNEEIFVLSEKDYKLSIEVFKKCLEVVWLRNVIIHSHYAQSIFSFNDGDILNGSKDFKTSKGYELRKYKFHSIYFDTINKHLEELFVYTMHLQFRISVPNNEVNLLKGISKLVDMNFEPPIF